MLSMAQTLGQTVQGSEIHYPGEPVPLDKMESESLPLLRQAAKQVRDAISATNKTLSDIDLQNKEGYEKFVAQFNSDPVFRLKITKDYYLFTLLFPDPQSRGRWVKYLDDVRAYERSQHQKQQVVSPGLTKTKPSSQPLQQEAHQPIFAWTHPDPSLSNIAKWHHYERELERITFNYHVRRTEVHRNSLDAGINRIDRVLDELRVAHGEGDRRGLDHFEALKGNYDKTIKARMDMSLHKPDGPYDIQKAAQQDKVIETLHKSMTDSLDSFFKTYFKTYGDKNPIINKLSAEHVLEKSKVNTEIKGLKSEFKEQSDQLNIHIKATSAASKKEIDDHLNAVLQTMRRIDVLDLDETKKERVANLVEKLKGYRETLKTTDDFEKIQHILAQSIQEINQTMSILPEATKQQVQLEAAALEKMVTTASPTPKTENLHPSVDSTVTAAHEGPKGHEDSEPIAQPPQEHSDAIPQQVPLESASSEPMVSTASLIQGAENQPHIPVESTISPAAERPVGQEDSEPIALVAEGPESQQDSEPIVPVAERPEGQQDSEPIALVAERSEGQQVSEPIALDSHEHGDTSKQTSTKESEKPLQAPSVPDRSHVVTPDAVSPSIINRQRDMKAVIQEARGKTKVDKCLNKIWDKIVIAETKKAFSQEEKESIEGIRKQIEGIKSFEDYQEFPPKVRTALSELGRNLEELGDECERLSNLKTELESVFVSTENSEQAQVSRDSPRSENSPF